MEQEILMSPFDMTQYYAEIANAETLFAIGVGIAALSGIVSIIMSIIGGNLIGMPIAAIGIIIGVCIGTIPSYNVGADVVPSFESHYGISDLSDSDGRMASLPSGVTKVQFVDDNGPHDGKLVIYKDTKKAVLYVESHDTEKYVPYKGAVSGTESSDDVNADQYQ